MPLKQWTSLSRWSKFSYTEGIFSSLFSKNEKGFPIERHPLVIEELLNKKKDIVFVLGNQAADLDSMVSSLTMAYIWNHLDHKNHHSFNVENFPSFAIPIFSIPRKEFKLRPQAKLLFEFAQVGLDNDGTPPDILFLDQINSHSFDFSNCYLALTDHNFVEKEISTIFPEHTIISVIDHHQDLGLYQNAYYRFIDGSCGSTCSLVVDFAINHCHEKIPEQLVKLLIGTILFDTGNFFQGKFNQIDVNAFQKLIEMLPNSMNSNENQLLFKRLRYAYTDVSNLTFNDLLKVDFKQSYVYKVTKSPKYANRLLGFSAIPISLTKIFDLYGSSHEIHLRMHEFLLEKKLDAIIMLCQSEFLSGDNRRGLVILTKSTENDNDNNLFKAIHCALFEIANRMPEKLRQNSLFIKQGIDCDGFDAHAWPLSIKSSNQSNFFSVKSVTTRKTLMPAFLETLAIL